ncbi:DUF5946 family protein [Kitasatospora sp. NPDC089797]|uniref:DUF5946 family protein n=1 Tax=Kitasatospora sp. NPDC089797 TaxID=3155298 RepID=UPI0034203A2A
MTDAGRCPECGARRCAELFHALLALDHSRARPWGPLHGVSVACFLLQHPGRLPGDGGAVARAFLRAYLEGGLPAVEELVGRARRANAHRVPGGPARTVEPAPAPPTGGFAVTVEHVAVDGTFPAAGFPERVRAWAAATLEAWAGHGG